MKTRQRCARKSLRDTVRRLPDDYAIIQKLADDGKLTVRIAYNLFTPKPEGEKAAFLNWTRLGCASWAV
jgi:predicted amidohydrolase YtcJ